MAVIVDGVADNPTVGGDEVVGMVNSSRTVIWLLNGESVDISAATKEASLKTGLWIPGATGGRRIGLGDGDSLTPGVTPGLPIMGYVDETALAELSEEKAGIVRIDQRKRLYSSSESRLIELTSVSAGTANPTGSDIRKTDGTSVIATTDLAIRTASGNPHSFSLPMHNWSRLTMTFNTTTAFSHTLYFQVYGSNTVGGLDGAKLLELTIPAAARRWSVGPGTVGPGGIVGTTGSIVDNAHYQVTALNDPFEYIIVIIDATSTAPTSGTLYMAFSRRAL